MENYHISVLFNEVLEFLQIREGKKYIDATLGGGGHSLGIVKKGGIVLGIDQDDDATQHVKAKSEEQRVVEKLTVVRGNFREIDRIAREHNFTPVAGILFDLGVSSHQLDSPERGFSFRESGPLDMRMDRNLTVTARDLINGLTQKELAELFYKLGEEYQSRTIASEIVKQRERKSIETTEELEKIVRHALGGRAKTTGRVTGIHPATKVFQAIRIAVNDELHSLEEALPKAVELLEKNGRLVVISFHSMEDRIVKQSFKEFARVGWGTILTEKPITPSEHETGGNSRARSAKLRVFEKTV